MNIYFAINVYSFNKKNKRKLREKHDLNHTKHKLKFNLFDVLLLIFLYWYRIISRITYAFEAFAKVITCV